MKLLVALDCQTLLEPGAGEAPLLQEPGTGEAVTGQAWPLGKPQGQQDLTAGEVVYNAEILQESTLVLGKKTPPPSMSLQCPLLREFDVMPAGKGDIFKGPSFIFTEQAMKGE